MKYMVSPIAVTKQCHVGNHRYSIQQAFVNATINKQSAINALTAITGIQFNRRSSTLQYTSNQSMPCLQFNPIQFNSTNHAFRQRQPRPSTVAANASALN
jgi:hypothetical protein